MILCIKNKQKKRGVVVFPKGYLEKEGFSSNGSVKWIQAPNLKHYNLFEVSILTPYFKKNHNYHVIFVHRYQVYKTRIDIPALITMITTTPINEEYTEVVSFSDFMKKKQST